MEIKFEEVAKLKLNEEVLKSAQVCCAGDTLRARGFPLMCSFLSSSKWFLHINMWKIEH